MKKCDLKAGQIVELKNGEIHIFTGVSIFNGDGCLNINNYDINLKFNTNSQFDIIAVYNCKKCFYFNNNLKKHLELVWERQEIKLSDTELSDTERVILENLPNIYVNISKALSGILYIGGGKNCNLSLSIYNHLFEFIKRGEKYLIEDLLNNK